MFAFAASLTWFIGLVLLFLGEMFFAKTGLKEPFFFIWMKNNKVMSFVALFFVNNIGNAQLATGAFEIYIDDVIVFSKLQTKHLPSAEDIQYALRIAGFE